MCYIAFFMLLLSYTTPLLCMHNQRRGHPNLCLANALVELPNIGESVTQKLIEHLAQGNYGAFTFLMEKNERVLSSNQIGRLLEQSIVFARYDIALNLIQRYGNIIENHINHSVPHNNTLSTDQILTYWLAGIRKADQFTNTH